MAARQLPGLGLYGFWGAGATGWDVENDENLRKTSALVHGSVIDMVATEPVSPSEGDRYIITSGLNADKFALYDNAGWVYYDPIPGLLIWSVAEGVFKNWNGSAWVNFDPSDAGVILGAATLDQIGNVNAIEPADGQVLTWDEASLEWQPKPLVDIVIGDLDAALQDVQDARDEAVAAAVNAPEGIYREYGVIFDSGFVHQGAKASGEGVVGFEGALPAGWSIVPISGEAGLGATDAAFAIKITNSTSSQLTTHKIDAREGDVFYGDMLATTLGAVTGLIRAVMTIRFYSSADTQIGNPSIIQQEFTTNLSGVWSDSKGVGTGAAVAPAGTAYARVSVVRSGGGSGTSYVALPRGHRMGYFETLAYAKLSPKMFGCVGDGVADDGVNLQKAADVAVALGLPLHFRENEIYAADTVDFPEHSVLTGHIRLKVRTAEQPRSSKRWMFRVGKRSTFDHIEFMGNNQFGFTRDVVRDVNPDPGIVDYQPHPDYNTGIYAELFVDDHAVGQEISVTDGNTDGTPRVLITGHGQRIGFFRASHYRDGSDVLQERTSAIGARRPLIISGEHSRDGARRPRDLSDLNDFLPSYVFDPTDLEDENGDPAPIGGPDGIPDAIQDYTGDGYTLWDDHIGVGFFLGGYDIRYFQRAVNLTYCDYFHIGPGICTGRSVAAEISPGDNGWLIAGCRFGTFVGQVVEDSGEHAIRLSSDNRRGCKSLTWHGLKVARQGPSAFKVNGGGGAGFSGGLVATAVAASLTRAQDIKVFDMSVEDPFIRPPTGDGKALHLIRVSHCEGFHLKGLVMSITDRFYGSGEIDPYVSTPYPSDPDGVIFAFSNTQYVTIDGVDFVNNCASRCLKINFVGNNDFESGDRISDMRNYLIRGVPMNHDTAGGQAAPIQINVDTGFGNSAIGDIDIVDAYFTNNTPMINYVNFSATPSGKIWVTGTVRNGTTLTHQGGSANNTNVSLKMSGSNSLLTGRAIDVL